MNALWKNKRTGQLWCASEWRGEILLSWQRGSGVAPVSTTRAYGSLAEVEARYSPVPDTTRGREPAARVRATSGHGPSKDE